jgi:hypothetical protein
MTAIRLEPVRDRILAYHFPQRRKIQMKKQFLLASGSILLVLAFAPSNQSVVGLGPRELSAATFVCPDFTCANESEGGTTTHKFSAGGPGNYDCAPYTCHSGQATLNCSSHDICIVASGLRKAGGAVMVAAVVNSGDRVKIAGLSAKFPNIRINRVRNVVQVFDCAGEVVAQYRIPDRTVSVQTGIAAD